jgi:hypothetical protein
MCPETVGTVVGTVERTLSLDIPHDVFHMPKSVDVVILNGWRFVRECDCAHDPQCTRHKVTT